VLRIRIRDPESGAFLAPRSRFRTAMNNPGHIS
jgi:hypothetical protein